jgi:hypothetical protein
MRVSKLVYIPTRFRQNTLYAIFIIHIDLNVHLLQIQTDVKLISLYIQITHCTNGNNRYLFSLNIQDIEKLFQIQPVDPNDTYTSYHVYMFCTMHSFAYEIGNFDTSCM